MKLEIKNNEVVNYIEETIIPNGITSIASNAFKDCTSLTSIIIPDSIQRIGKDAFRDCNNLKEVHISSIESWCNIEFENKNSNPLNNYAKLYINGELVNNIVIPDGVTSIGDYAFCCCFGLKSIVIPDSVMSIGNQAFSECVDLEEVHISSIESWCNIKFEDINSNPLSIDPALLINDVKLYLNGRLVENLVIPDGVTSIKDHAFRGYKGLTSITIPNSVISIGFGVFSCCENLKEVYISSLESWCKIEFEDYDSNPLCNGAKLYLNGELVENLVIPDGITSIGNYAFYHCNSLTSIVVPSSVKTINKDAFRKCENLAVLNLPETIEYIADDAFEECPKLTGEGIPDSVHERFRNAFGWVAVSIGE